MKKSDNQILINYSMEPKNKSKTVARLDNLAVDGDYNQTDELKDLIDKKQPINSLPANVCIYIKERKPMS